MIISDTPHPTKRSWNILLRPVGVWPMRIATCKPLGSSWSSCWWLRFYYPPNIWELIPSYKFHLQLAMISRDFFWWRIWTVQHPKPNLANRKANSLWHHRRTLRVIIKYGSWGGSNLMQMYGSFFWGGVGVISYTDPCLSLGLMGLWGHISPTEEPVLNL